GFNAVRAGVNGFVVNSHCTDVQGQVTGTQHYQPSVANGNLIGTEIADPAWDPMKCPLGLTGHLCRYSDTAYSQRAAGVAADQGERGGGRTRRGAGLRRALQVLREGTVVKGATVGSGLRPLPQFLGGPPAVSAAWPRLPPAWQRQRDARAPATGLAPRSP